MLIKTRGIVFRNQKYGETSVIIDVYTEEKGLQTYIVHGVRKAKARVSPSLVQVMSLIELVAYSRDDRTLHHTREIRPEVVYQSIPFDLKKGAVGLFMVEMARKSIREVEENRPLFDFLHGSFLFLDQIQASVANFHLYFLCELAAYLGFQPDGTASEETPFFDLQEGSFTSAIPDHSHYVGEAHSLLLSQLLASTPETVGGISLSRPDRRALLHHLMDFYRLHIEHFPTIHSHQVLEAVF